MEAVPPSPWALLLSLLRRASDPRITRADLDAAGLDPEPLLRAGLIERVKDAWAPAECEHACSPNLDFKTRRAEGLVGVACPRDPACWPGWRYYPARLVEVYTCSAATVLGALREANHLQPLNADLGPGVVPVGEIERGGSRFAVVHVRRAVDGFEAALRGWREKAGAGLIVLMGRMPSPFMPIEGVALLDLAPDPDGDLHLDRAVCQLIPDLAEREIRDPLAVLEGVSIAFGVEAGQHVVRLNGHPLPGFRASDLKFARLLHLAAERANGAAEGWVPKHRLHGDEKDHDLEQLRAELRKGDHPMHSPETRGALIKRRPGRAGEIRLAVPPSRIRFDPTLTDLTLDSQKPAAPRGKRETPGMEKLARNLARATVTTRALLIQAQRLGVAIPPHLLSGSRPGAPSEPDRSPRTSADASRSTRARSRPSRSPAGGGSRGRGA